MKIYYCLRQIVWALLTLSFTLSAPASWGQNLVINGSMNGRHQEARVAKGWTAPDAAFINSPDLNDDNGPLRTTSGYRWSGGNPVPSPDGGSWQNVFGQESFTQTISGLSAGQTYYFSYYYCTQGIEKPGIDPYVTPSTPKISIVGASGYTDPVDAGILFSWNKYEGKIVAEASSVTITVSSASDVYMAFDGFYLSVQAPSLPVIGQQPLSYTSCTHGSADFKVKASNASSFQWQENSGSEWNDLSDDHTHKGAATANLQVLDAVDTLDGVRFQCIVRSHCCQIATNPVSLKVTTPAHPQVSIESSADPACAGTVISFTAAAINEGATPIFQWFKNNSPVGSNDASFSSKSLKEGDQIKCQITSSSGCRTSEKATSNNIVVHVRPVVPSAVKITSSATIVCQGSPVTCTANAVNPGASPSYHWKKNGVTVGGNDSQYTDESVQDGDQIKCYLLSSETCATPSPTVSDVITLRVFPVLSPSISIAANSSAVCEGDTVTYTATALSPELLPVYKWKKNGEEVAGGSNIYTDIHPSSGQKISCVVYSSYGCTAASSLASNMIETIVHPRPSVDLGNDSVLCSGVKRELSPGNFSTYLWTDGSTNPTMLVSAPGSYGVRVTDGNGCTSGDTMLITTLVAAPGAFMPPDTAICGYGDLVLVAKSGYSAYLWSTGSTMPTTQVTAPGTYTLEVTGDYHCVSKGSVTVYPKDCQTGFFMPNAFTPNGDGKNDYFRPTILGTVSFYKLSIFNRWGQLIFTSSDPQHGWNGELHEVPGGPETFVWTCVYQLSGGVRQNRTGKLILLR